jgi:hypothetical protein
VFGDEHSRLCRISCTDADEYEVVLDIDDERQTMLCRVVECDGMRVVQPRPDLMSRLTFSPRLLAAAILAFDEARKEGHKP